VDAMKQVDWRQHMSLAQVYRTLNH